MRNLWVFISKYNAFFFFIIFFVTSVSLIIRNNSYQRAEVINSSNRITGTIYSKANKIESYLSLTQVNDSLAAENAYLRGMLRESKFDDSLVQKTVHDTLSRQEYAYIVAKVVNNSINQKNNYLTINRGKKHGIAPGMGVIGHTGIVGIVKHVSDNYATVRSLLHNETRVSASIKENNAFGSLRWGDKARNIRTALLRDIPNHITVKLGQHVVTSSYSTVFPPGLPIGRVIGTRDGGESFPEVEVRLSTDFATLQYVYVVKNFFADEKLQLEALSKQNE